jgi:hypothetical protein
MLPVSVTIMVGGRAMSVEDIADAGLAATLRSAGQDVARKLAAIRCPVHHETATDVRVQFDAHGRADLRYESCCEKLGKRIGTALGG